MGDGLAAQVVGELALFREAVERHGSLAHNSHQVRIHAGRQVVSTCDPERTLAPAKASSSFLSGSNMHVSSAHAAAVSPAETSARSYSCLIRRTW